MPESGNKEHHPPHPPCYESWFAFLVHETDQRTIQPPIIRKKGLTLLDETSELTSLG
ncbi:hypothetical protein HanIR_Chr03g0141971 [Helianthus annuus]|nr:hypothetical protein HanIR_Chr03g0141971 [Helianthus annuus]